MVATNNAGVSYRIRMQSSGSTGGDWIEHHRFLREMRTQFGCQKVDAFLAWFSKTHRLLIAMVADEMRWEVGQPSVEVDVDQMLVTAFMTWLAARKLADET